MWRLTVYGPAAGMSWILAELDALERLRKVASVTTGALGPAIATYTAVLLSDTATPVWHEAKAELPFVFAGGATTALALLDRKPSGVAARIAALGAIGELAAAFVMKRRLGPLDTYSSDESARRFDRAALTFPGAGAIGALVLPQRRAMTALSSGAILVGSLCQRMAVVRAGTASARDPRAVLDQQRSSR